MQKTSRSKPSQNPSGRSGASASRRGGGQREDSSRQAADGVHQEIPSGEQRDDASGDETMSGRRTHWSDDGADQRTPQSGESDDRSGRSFNER